MNNKYRILIATYPFAKTGRKPLEILEQIGCEIIHNPYGRRLKEDEVGELIKDVDIVIAGTEQYSIDNLKKSKLKAICRVGIGLDNVPLKECKEFGIQVTYTPDAPSQGVAELTLANIINLSRQILHSDISVRQGAWNRYMGYLLSELTIGIIGIGRIGQRVVKLLQPFEPTILAYDINPNLEFSAKYNIKWVSKEELLKRGDIISLHIPSYPGTKHFINRKAISLMKTGSYLINTSRGAIVDEKALVDAILQKHIGGAALDVFEKEPYEGPLIRMENVVLTAHMGASANASRYLMELGAAEDCIRIMRNEVPAFDAIKDNAVYYNL
jgi:D-3-phosphoglycerate dehydrogenase